MEKKRPQLSLADLHRLKWLLGGLLVLLSISTVLYLEIDAWILMGVTAGAVGLGLAKPTLPARMPAAIHWLAFPAIVAIFLGDLYLTTQVLPALVRLDILLLLYRGITYRQRRDDLQIVVLGLFLIVLAGVLTVSLFFAVQILAFSACALVFLLVVTLVQAVEAKPTPIVAGEVPTWAKGAWRGWWTRVRAAADWRMAVIGGALFGGLVLLAGLLFLAIPRVELENSLLLERFMTKKSRTGFSDRIQFGDVTDIQQDNRVAVSIDLTDPSKIPAQPYWRMVVLDEYREESFRLSAPLRRAAFSRERSEAAVRGQARARLGAQDYWTFYLEAGVSRYLPLAGHFEMLRFRERQNFQVAAELGVVALRDEPVSMTAYRVEGMLTSAELIDREFGDEWDRHRAQGSEASITQLLVNVSAGDRAKLAQVVAEVEAGAILGVDEFAGRTSAWLARRHAYGLQSRTPSGEGDALVRWLVSGEPGHCELFAGALVLLARTAQIPARVVTGFRGGSWNGFSNNFALRNSDAHAWCELYDRDTQTWLRVDPTPGSQVLADRSNALSAVDTRQVDRSWTARFDSLRIFWYRRIVNFDQRSQVETIKAVKEATQETGRRLRAWIQGWSQRVKEWLTSPWDVRRGVRWLAGVAVLGVAAWAASRLVGAVRRGRWHRTRGQSHPVRKAAGRWRQRLQGRGADAALIADLERLRFGHGAAWPEPAAVFARARREWKRVRQI